VAALRCLDLRPPIQVTKINANPRYASVGIGPTLARRISDISYTHPIISSIIQYPYHYSDADYLFAEYVHSLEA
jgi:hypothetical protein